jgi:hypothetical protein
MIFLEKYQRIVAEELEDIPPMGKLDLQPSALADVIKTRAKARSYISYIS